MEKNNLSQFRLTLVRSSSANSGLYFFPLFPGLDLHPGGAEGGGQLIGSPFHISVHWHMASWSVSVHAHTTADPLPSWTGSCACGSPCHSGYPRADLENHSVGTLSCRMAPGTHQCRGTRRTRCLPRLHFGQRCPLCSQPVEAFTG